MHVPNTQHMHIKVILNSYKINNLPPICDSGQPALVSLLLIKSISCTSLASIVRDSHYNNDFVTSYVHLLNAHLPATLRPQIQILFSYAKLWKTTIKTFTWISYFTYGVVVPHQTRAIHIILKPRWSPEGQKWTQITKITFVYIHIHDVLTSVKNAL